MLEKIVLGAVQGIAEWLPVSSEGLIVLVKTQLFSDTSSLDAIMREALFFHFGTFLAALVYLRKDVGVLFKALMNRRSAEETNRNILSFLIVSTLVTGVVGLLIFTGIQFIHFNLLLTGKIITFGIGLCLIFTAFLQIRMSRGGARGADELNWKDGVLLGFVQGCSVIPGLSRSGLTVAALLFRKVNKSLALRLSFLMSLPVVLFGNILLNTKDLFSFRPDFLLGTGCAFLFGLLTIHALLTLARRVNFGYFVLLFAFVTIMAAFF